MRFDSSPKVRMDSPLSVFDLHSDYVPNSPIKMKYATLKLGEKTLDQKLDLTTDLAAALLTNVAVYALPDPTPAALTGKVTAIRAKMTEVSNAQTVLDTKLSELDALEVDLDNSLTDETAYIQKASHGVEATIALLGVPVRSTPAPVAAPEKLRNFRLMPGKNAGEVKSACKPDGMAASYEYHWATDPTKEENWKHLDVSSGCRAKFTERTSGQTMWVRGRAIGKNRRAKVRGATRPPSPCRKT